MWLPLLRDMRAWLALLCWTSLAPCAAVPGSEEQAGKHHVAVSHIKSKGSVTGGQYKGSGPFGAGFCG